MHPEWHRREHAKDNLHPNVQEDLFQMGFRCSNIDLTIIAQRPKIGPHIAKMKENISEIAGIEPSLIGIKATTHEKIGSLGREEGIATHAVCLLAAESS